MGVSSVFIKLKEMINQMLGTSTIENTLQITPLISGKMVDEIELWSDMYEDKAPWLREPTANDPTRIVSLGLPAFIASEKARMAMIEFESEITAPVKVEEVENPDYFAPTSDAMGNIQVSGQPRMITQETPTSPTERAEFMNEQYQRKLLTRLRTQLELGIAKGSLIIKPYVVKVSHNGVAGVSNNTKEDRYEIEFDFIQADACYPISFDGSGKLTACAFVQCKADKDIIYIRLEYHELTGSTVKITNRAFMNKNSTLDQVWNGDLGKEIKLTDVDEWKVLPKEARIDNVDRLLFGYFKMPEANTVDPHSPLGVSGFARAKNLIKDADMQYSRLLWEYEAGEMAIDVDRDAFNFLGDGDDGMTRLPIGQQRLYRQVDLGESDTFKPYSPPLRDSNYITGLNTILMRIEDVCAISRGTISEVASEARTATELKILKQRSYSANIEIQKALENALNDVIYTMDVYCTLYNIVGDVPKNADGSVDVSKIGKYDVSFDWDDSIIVDVEAELGKRITLMTNGLTSKKEVRKWYFGETDQQASDALDKIRKENQESMEMNIQMAQMAGGGNTNNNNDDGNNVFNETEKAIFDKE